jgi:putative aminopeptidase FrvX
MSATKALLRELSEANGVSGDESAVMAIVRRELTGYADSIEEDGMGNLIATRKGRDKSVMIAAHADEIGLMVKNIDDKGFITFSTIGGFFSQSLLNQKVVIPSNKGDIIGVIGSKAPHVMDKAEQDTVVKTKTMFIDIGAENKEQVTELGIEPGTFMTLQSKFECLIGDKVSGKALDNRIGVLVMIEAMKRTQSPYTVYGVASTQEEVGLRGARTAAFKLNPDVAIVVDTGIPTDHPGMTKEDGDISIGKGPLVTIMDGGVIITKKMLDYTVRKAKVMGISIQKEVSASGGTTDAAIVHMIREGILTGVVAVATRYLHSPVETASMADVEDAIELVTRMTEDLEEVV